MGTLSGRGLLICAFCVCRVSPSSPRQAPGAGPQFPSPSSKHLSLPIKFSIFGVLVSYFPGTERRSERDWKQPFVLRPQHNFPVPSFCPFPHPRPAPLLNSNLMYVFLSVRVHVLVPGKVPFPVAFYMSLTPCL